MTKTSIACDAQLTKYRLQSVLVCTLNLPAYQSLNHLSSSSVIEGYCEIVSRDVNETYWRLCLPGTQDFHCSLAVFSTCNIRHRQCFRAEEGKKNKNRKAADWGELRNLDSDLVLKGLQMILNFLGNWPNFHRSHPSSNLSSPPSVQERSRHLLCELTFLQLSRKLKNHCCPYAVQSRGVKTGQQIADHNKVELFKHQGNLLGRGQLLFKFQQGSLDW